MKIGLASALIALAALTGCASSQQNDDVADDASEVVGVTDLTEMESAFGLVKDVKLANGKWSRGDALLTAGACWKARFGAGAAHPENWEFRRYKNGAAFFRKLGVGPLEGDERAIRCVDIDVKEDGTTQTSTLEGLGLDVAFRHHLGKLGGEEGAAGHLYVDFDKAGLEVKDADHACGFADLQTKAKTIDPDLTAGRTAYNACTAAHGSDCDAKAYAACKTAFATDVKGNGSIDRPAFHGMQLVGSSDSNVDASVAAFVYAYSTKANTDARAFSMASDPIGSFKSRKGGAVDEVMTYEHLTVHHVTLATHVEGIYLVASNAVGDPVENAKASCERPLDAQGEPTAAYTCKGL